MQHVLVPLDTSKLAERALSAAREIVKPGGTITLIQVVEPAQPERYIEPHYADQFLRSEYGRADATTLHHSRIDRAAAYLRGIIASPQMQGYEVKLFTASGDPADIILETAAKIGVDAIVMSTHGRSGLSKLVYGSVTQKVLSSAACPVLVVPMKAAA